MQRRPGWLGALAAGSILAVGLVVPFQLVSGAVAPADAADAATWSPGLIITDSQFYDAQAMSAPQIQQFLESKEPFCGNSNCLRAATVSPPSYGAVISSKTGNVVCNAIAGGTMPVSEWIYRTQVACGISARAILVTLEKEQGLVTATSPSDSNLRAAMGMACPDTAPCDTAYAGLATQIYTGTKQLKTYRAANFARQPGTYAVQYNPNPGCGSSIVSVQDYATAALYNYTPYQPNPAALANLYGIGDSCSAYGNRNFWRTYSDWFGNPHSNLAFGWLDSATLRGTTLTAGGWAIDPDTSAPISVQLIVDGTTVATATANLARPGLGAIYPAAGDNHGYSFSTSLTVGQHYVCVGAVDDAGGPGVRLAYGGPDGVDNCASVIVSAPPVGWMDGVAVSGNALSAKGWAIDPDVAAPIQVQLVVDGTVAATGTADAARVGLSAVYPAAGDNHGFSINAIVPPGRHTVCVVAVNNAPGANTTLNYVGDGATANCASVLVSTPPFGWMDATSLVGSSFIAKGWAIDPDSTGTVRVQLVVDGAVAVSADADQIRSGLGEIYPNAGGDAHGFTLSTKLSVGPHTICAVALDREDGPSTRLYYQGNGASNNCAVVTYPGPARPVGWMDSAQLIGPNFTATGWAIDTDTAAAIPVQLIVDGAVVTTVTANATRPGLGSVYPGFGDDHGFTVAAALGVGTHTICIGALDDASSAASRLLYQGPGALNNCAVLTYAGPSQPIGWVDSVTLMGATLTAVGWTIDKDTTGPVSVQLLVDGAIVADDTANITRPGLGAVYPGYGDDHGFTLTAASVASGTHTVCVVALDEASKKGARLSYNGIGASSNCATVTVSAAPFGWMDSAVLSGSTLTASGWAIDPDTSAAIQVQLFVDGAAVITGTAAVARPGLGAIYPAAGDAHGFTLSAALTTGTHIVCAVALNNAPGANTRLTYQAASASNNCAQVAVGG